jgi:hypothetical protein
MWLWPGGFSSQDPLPDFCLLAAQCDEAGPMFRAAR